MQDTDRTGALVKALRAVYARIRQDISALRAVDPASGATVIAATQKAISIDMLRRHVSGEQAVGAYPMAEGSSETLIAVADIDDHGGLLGWDAVAQAGKDLSKALAARGVRTVPWRSSGGNGIHLYALWDVPQDAYSVRMLFGEALGDVGMRPGAGGLTRSQVEVFPKQNRIPEGKRGNMFVLPLFKHSVPLHPDTFAPLPRHEAENLAWLLSEPVPLLEAPPVQVAREVTAEDLKKLQSALAAIPNTGRHALEYDVWRNIVFGIHAATHGSDDGLQLALQFSQKSEKHDEAFFLNRVWPYVTEREDGVGIDYVFARAADYGWQKTSPEDFPDYSDYPQNEDAILPQISRLREAALLAQIEEPTIALRPEPETVLDLRLPPPTATPSLFDTPAPWPGVIADLVEAGMRASVVPQPELMLAAVLTGIAGCIPSRYRMSESGNLRPNIYALGVTATGSGKEVPRRVAETIVGLGGGVVSHSLTGGEALEDKVSSTFGEGNPRGQPILLSFDEAAEVLGSVTAARTPQSSGLPGALSRNLLRFFSASSGVYVTRDKASAAGRRLEHPMLSMLAFGTPTDVGNSLSYDVIDKGLGNRLIFARGRDAEPGRDMSDVHPFVVPSSAEEWAAALRTGMFPDLGVTDLSPEEVQNTSEIRFADPRARDYFAKIRRGQDALRCSSKNPLEVAIAARTTEVTLRVACLLAVTDCAYRPAISREHLEWSLHYMRSSISVLKGYITEFVASSDTERNAKAMIRAIRKVLAGELRTQRGEYKGLSASLLQSGTIPTALIQTAAGVGARNFGEALDLLVRMGLIGVTSTDGIQYAIVHSSFK